MLPQSRPQPTFAYKLAVLRCCWTPYTQLSPLSSIHRASNKMHILVALTLLPTLLVPSTLATVNKYRWHVFNYKGECGEPTDSPEGNCVYSFNVTAPEFTTPDNSRIFVPSHHPDEQLHRKHSC